MDRKYDELKSKYQKLYEENYQLKTILDQVDNPIVLSDAEGIITFYNKAMAKLDNLDQKEVLGKHIGDIYPVENHTRVTETNEFIDFRYHYYSTISQKKIPTVAACYPIVLPENGKMLGAYSFLRDLTHIQELEEKIA
ncbi:MAG: PAS domain-containing protein, partial [Firmicutes bacterium]|nr:PAS domain-containing protein [Bacillota bacterium]